MYKFQLPVGGQEVEWKPLSYGQELDLIGAHKRDEMRHLLEPALVCARIIKMGDKTQCATSDLRQLDAYDVEALIEDMQLRDAERKAMLRKKGPSKAISQQMEAALEEIQSAATQFGAAMKAALNLAKAVESADPLK